MLQETSSSMLMFFVFINKLKQKGHLEVCKESTKVLQLDSYASNYFTCGRDVNGSPYVGVQSDLLPFFIDVPWVEVCIDRKGGYLYLVAKNVENLEVLLAFGLKLRRKRLNVICDPDTEHASSMELNLKKLTLERTAKGVSAIISDSNIYTGIKLREIVSPSDISTHKNEEFEGLLAKSGIEESYTILDM
ncbi:MAG: hypothetical protein HAW67_06695 [Endozoicomonadaceae bacterium]|nr:hypothetical protein [Endozoicomonadaceae bacterium]